MSREENSSPASNSSEVFPEVLAAVDDAAVAQVEQVDGDQRRLGVVGEDVGVVALGGGHLLLLFDLFDGGDQVPQRGGFLIAHFGGGFVHAGAQVADQVAVAALEEEPDVPDGGGMFLHRGQPLNAGSKAAVDVILQAGLRVVAREVHLAGWDLEVPVDEMAQAMGQIAGKVRTVVSGAVLAEAPGNIDARVLFLGELDVGIGLVVAQQNVEAGLPALDQVVLERQGLFLVVDQDVLEVLRLRDQGAGLGVGEALL